jgi:N-carbamoyl-L-amino-acid hydrolase
MTSDLDVSTKAIEAHFSALSQIGNLGPDRKAGFLRAAWSDEETAAMEYIKQTGQARGLRGTYDGVGNLFLTTPGPTRQVVQIGSHLDTVPRGGMFDGGAGIVAGLEAILALQNFWPGLKQGLELVIWRGEESATFDAVCKGSRAAFGRNDPAILANEFGGRTLEQAILSQEFDPTFIRDGKPTLSSDRIDSIAAHLELHIEQATKLEAEGKAIGIATSTRGTARLRVIVTGEAAHSGGTPMGVTYRKDANLAMAYMQVELDRLARQTVAEGQDLVQTVGVINSDEGFNRQHPQVYDNALTKVSPFGYFTLDVRSNRQAQLERYVTRARALIREVGQKFKVGVGIESITFLEPLERFEESLQASLEERCQTLGYSYLKMACGALHDVAVVASQQRSDGSKIPGALILIPCRQGLSHNPQEYASPEAIQKGAMVLAQTLSKLAA